MHKRKQIYSLLKDFMLQKIVYFNLRYGGGKQQVQYLKLLGPRELKRDIGTRLFKFRGDIRREMNHYHDRGELIISSFVSGVNAYIDLTEKKPELLPLEFKLLGTKPQKWTPEVVISRHQGLLGNIGQELSIGRAVALLGPEKVKELSWFHPNEPKLTLDSKINTKSLF